MLTKISFGNIKKDLMNSLSGLNEDDKNQRLVNFCVSAGINNFRAGANKKGQPKIFDEDDDPVDSKDIIELVVDVCVKGEVSRLQRRIASGVRGLTRRQQNVPEELIEEDELIAPGVNYNDEISDILSLSGADSVNAVAAFCNKILGREAFTVKVKKGKLKLFDEDDEVVDSADYAQTMIDLVTKSAFGKRSKRSKRSKRMSKKQKAHRLKFKKAVKKCKGKKNFRKCLSKLLKK
jgi:hypothetical protein